MHQHKGDREEVVTCSIEEVRSHAHEPPFTRLLDFSTGRVLSLLAITAYWLLNAVTIWLFWGRSTRIESDRGVSDGWLMFFIELLMSQVSSFVGAWLLSVLAKFLLLFFNGQRVEIVGESAVRSRSVSSAIIVSNVSTVYYRLEGSHAIFARLRAHTPSTQDASRDIVAYPPCLAVTCYGISSKKFLAFLVLSLLNFGFISCGISFWLSQCLVPYFHPSLEVSLVLSTCIALPPVFLCAHFFPYESHEDSQGLFAGVGLPLAVVFGWTTVVNKANHISRAKAAADGYSYNAVCPVE